LRHIARTAIDPADRVGHGWCLSQRPESYEYSSDGVGQHRDLHRFPTRRSSDLARRMTNASAPASPFVRAVEPDAQAGQPGLGLRSEEHTSELQSLRHLVCRLLLVKKKTKGTPVLGVSYQRIQALRDLPGSAEDS